MFCDKCKKNEASVHITKIINGVKYEVNLCEKCAKETEGLGNINNMNFDETAFSFQNILSEIMEYINQSNQVMDEKEVVCKNCGTSYSQFKKTGLFGCSKCYENFNETLIPVIKRMQANTEHIGKVPKKSGKQLLERKKLLGLKEELQKAIFSEEYERAAEIRDAIRKIQNGEEGK